MLPYQGLLLSTSLQSFIFPVPEIINSPSLDNFALTLSFKVADISHSTSSVYADSVLFSPDLSVYSNSNSPFCLKIYMLLPPLLVTFSPSAKCNIAITSPLERGSYVIVPVGTTTIFKPFNFPPFIVILTSFSESKTVDEFIFILSPEAFIWQFSNVTGESSVELNISCGFNTLANNLGIISWLSSSTETAILVLHILNASSPTPVISSGILARVK